jgi:hypothetical protein
VATVAVWSEQINEFPSQLCPEYCGKGIGLWQIPQQIAPTLLYLSSFKIRSYLEVGCAAGGTFMFVTEFLRSTNGLQRSTCVDVAAPGENTHSSEDENKGSPYFGILYEYLTQHKEYASFYVGTSDAYARAHPGGPVGGSAPSTVADGAWGRGGRGIVSESVCGVVCGAVWCVCISCS